MNKSDIPPCDLTREKSLLDVYRASRIIPTVPFNRYSTLVILLLLLLNSGFMYLQGINPYERLIDLIEIGLTISLSILGFLLAGFTIFATVTQRSLSINMSKIEDRETGLSYLKRTYFTFMRVFIYYLAFAITCLLIYLFKDNGISRYAAIALPGYTEISTIANNLAFALIGSAFYFLLVQLKSFIFNVYHAVMTSLRWERENSKD